MLGALNDSTILRLRVKGSDLDPLALRGRLENLLGEVSFQPRLPPSATLFIRKLNDPMPGLLQLDTTHPRAPEAWRHAFNSRFDQLVSSAARPAHGLVSDSVESVVFYDYAELLASLTADWCSGYATTRWWWQGLIKRGDVAQVIKQLWREKVEYIPAALEQLVKRNVLVEFVSRLSDDEVRVLVQRVVHVFGLHEMRRVIDTDRVSSAAIVARTDVIFSHAMSSGAQSIEEAAVRRLMPWRYTVPESDTPRLRPIQQMFVGVGLMIRRAASRVRKLSFAKEVEQWQEQVINLSRVHERQVAIDEEARDLPQESVSDVTEAISVADGQDSKPDVVNPPVPPKRKREQVKIGNAVFSYEEREQVSPIDSEQSIEATVESEKVLVHIDPEIEPSLEIPAAREPLDAITIETELGGLFYLINLAIFLNIDDDLGIWEFVLIVGAELLGEQKFDDPIWTGLQDLNDDSQDKNLVNPAENPVNPVKPTWLTDLLPALRTRLRSALGITTETDLANLLLHHHAKVIITATHLDVFFSLADHPIEIRLSGLDRNPGWVPAAGRFIAFHYD